MRLRLTQVSSDLMQIKRISRRALLRAPRTLRRTPSIFDVDQGAARATPPRVRRLLSSQTEAEKRADVMTHRPPRRSPRRPIKPAPPPIPAEGDPLAALRQRVATVRVRRRQQLSFAAGHAEAVYIVRTGLLVLQTTMPGKHRQLLALLYPRDVFRAALVPPLPAASLSAVAASEVWRLPASTFETLLGTDPALAQHMNRRLADQHARTILHVAMIGGLNGEERVASFLIELALRIGSPCASGTSFEIPLSRTDIADYLALNADTLSRIMSRLKARGLVVQTGRGRAAVPDWEALCGHSPVAGALVALHGAAIGDLLTS